MPGILSLRSGRRGWNGVRKHSFVTAGLRAAGSGLNQNLGVDLTNVVP